MKLFQIGETDIKLHPGLLIVIAGALVLGMAEELLLSFFALTLHEIFHAIVARSMGYRVYSVEFLPFGGVAQLGKQSFSLQNDFFIAAAGPICSFIVAGAVSMVSRYFPDAQDNLRYFLQANIILALFNLLPALPLDGGRMLRSVLGLILRPRAAALIASWIGVALGTMMLTFAGYLVYRGAVNIFLFVMGVFLLISAVREIRVMPQAQVHAMMRRREALLRGEAVSMRHVAIRADMPASAALRQLSASRYNLLLILDDDLRVIGQLDEGTLLTGIAKHGQNICVGKLIKKK